ncbi:MAG: type II toxin-antitoxin system VapC family toxin [Myxococcales bacterium]|nr:type II toxin-antitoxin system VapC family toxin [Myxococcales bacterium]
MKLVVDASVGAKWLLAEALSPKALGLLQPENDLLVPELFWAEVGNILWKKARSGELSEGEAIKRFDGLGAIGLRTVSNTTAAPGALRVALSTGRTVYDSLYIALAQNEACRFVTADERLVNGLAGSPYDAHVVWLGAM